MTLSATEKVITQRMASVSRKPLDETARYWTIGMPNSGTVHAVSTETRHGQRRFPSFGEGSEVGSVDSMLARRF